MEEGLKFLINSSKEEATKELLKIKCPDFRFFNQGEERPAGYVSERLNLILNKEGKVRYVYSG